MSSAAEWLGSEVQPTSAAKWLGSDDIREPLQSPPGLGGDIIAPPGLGVIGDAAANEKNAQWSPWSSFGAAPLGLLGQGMEMPGLLPEPMMQVTSSPGEDWKTLFSYAGHDLQDSWQCEEPAVVHLSDDSTEEGLNTSGSDDDPAYVSPSLGPQPDHEGEMLTENEILTAENVRLAMENEMLKMRSASWASAVNSGDSNSAGYWAGESSPGSMDMTWAGMNQFFPTPWPMMPMADRDMSMWQWGAAGMSPGQHQHNSRARTDSDVGSHKARERRRLGSDQDMGRSSRALSDVNDLHAVGEEFTGPYLTVMLRNLPNNYTRSMLLKLIDSEGFDGMYDFIYLPMDFKSQASLGYAFVNLTDSDQAARFFEAFVGFHDWVVPSQKVCSVNWSAPYQGREAHIERYRNSPVMHEDVPDDYKPMVFRDGERIKFPPPTKKLKVPRMRVANEKTLLSEGGMVEDP